MTNILSLIKDPYERKARILPGLILILPFITLAISVFGPKDLIISSLGGVLLGCGITFILGSFCRSKGKQIEERLYNKWGGVPTTILLRHHDRTISDITKNKYHIAISKKLKITLPTKSQEFSDNSGSDAIYEHAMKELRLLRRCERNLIFLENINYGYNRNMLGVKPYGIISALTSIIISSTLMYYGSSEKMLLLLSHFETSKYSFYIINIIISFFVLFIWLLAINEKNVKMSGFAYAEQLLDSLLNEKEDKE